MSGYKFCHQGTESALWMRQCHGHRLLVWLIAALLLAGVSPTWADSVKGRIDVISNKARTIQIDVKGKLPVVVRFGDQTRYEGAADIDELGPPDLIEVEYEPGKPATLVKKIVFGLPDGVEIDIHEMLAILQGQRGPYLLGDARPAAHYPAGHIPSAVSTPVNDRDAFLSSLPDAKGQLLVFYCGGPTCPFTGEAVEMAKAAGYTNLKGFQAGLPGWKKSKLPVHTSNHWLAKKLDPHHVVIDVRDPALALVRHIPAAVGIPADRFPAMTQEFIATQREAMLPGVSDKRAPIVLYANSHVDAGVLVALRELLAWGYKNVSILEGGLEQWLADELPVASGALATRITYTKELVEGAIEPKEFMALVGQPEKALLLDVRSSEEVARFGPFANARHLPLDSLEDRLDELPKDQEIIAYCVNGIRAEMAYRTLKDQGFQVRFLNEVIEFDESGEHRTN